MEDGEGLRGCEGDLIVCALARRFRAIVSRGHLDLFSKDVAVLELQDLQHDFRFVLVLCFVES